ncbi:MAG: protein kinase [Planctomycetota bacterium]
MEAKKKPLNIPSTTPSKDSLLQFLKEVDTASSTEVNSIEAKKELEPLKLDKNSKTDPSLRIPQSSPISSAQTQVPPMGSIPLNLQQEKGPIYQIGEKIAEGGMGYIYEATDSKLQRKVAMKILKPPKSVDGYDELARFVTEARTTGVLEHPNIMPVHDLGISPEGQYFFTMKRIQGQSLGNKIKALINREDLEWTLGSILQIFLKICDAISFAHSRGILHRDLKPDNIMLGDYGEVLVLDWGLAKFRVISRKLTHKNKLLKPKNSKSSKQIKTVSEETSVQRTSKSLATTLSEELVETLGEGRKGYQTLDGMVIGTPEYMPPEQAKGLTEELDERADIYALGTILYEMLTLDLPYKGETYEDVLMKVCTESVLSPSTKLKERQRENKRTSVPSIPLELEAIILTCMEEKKENRYSSVKKLSQDILKLMAGDPVSVFQDSPLRRWFKWGKRHPVLVGILSSSILLGSFLLSIIAALNNKKNQTEFMVLQQRIKLAEENTRSTSLEKEKNVALLEKLNLDQIRSVEQEKQIQAFSPYTQGMEMMERRFYQKAAENFQMALDANPEFISASLQLAKCNINLGFYLAAVENLKKCIEILEENQNAASMVQPLFMLGQIYLNDLEEKETASQYFKKAKELNPQSPYGQLGQAMYLYEMRQYAECLGLVNELLEKENIYYLWEAYYLKGKILAQKAIESKPLDLVLLEEAKLCFQDALKADQDLPLVHFELFSILFNVEKKYEWAQKHIDRIIEENPSSTKFFYYQSLNLFYLKRYEEALVAVNQAIKHLRPERAGKQQFQDTELGCLYLQTEIFLRLENISKARSGLKRLESYKIPDIHLQWGRFFQLEQKYDKALEEYLKDGSFYGIIYYLSLQNHLGKLESEAVPYLQKNLDGISDPQIKSQIEGLIQSLKEDKTKIETWLIEIQKEFKK